MEENKEFWVITITDEGGSHVMGVYDDYDKCEDDYYKARRISKLEESRGELVEIGKMGRISEAYRVEPKYMLFLLSIFTNENYPTIDDMLVCRDEPKPEQINKVVIEDNPNTESDNPYPCIAAELIVPIEETDTSDSLIGKAIKILKDDGYNLDSIETKE